MLVQSLNLGLISPLPHHSATHDSQRIIKMFPNSGACLGEKKKKLLLSKSDFNLEGYFSTAIKHDSRV